MPNPLLLVAGIAALAAPLADRDAVAQLDRTYQEAVKRNDTDTMKKIMHPDFQLVLGDGQRFGRDDLLNDARRGSFIYELQDEEPNSQSVMVWGNTAIVTAKLLLKGTQEGKPFDRTLWFSDTYVRTDRGWKYYFGQASLPLPNDQQASRSGETETAHNPAAIGLWPAGGF
jgi:ketosteroid isomerase-like protein